MQSMTGFATKTITLEKNDGQRAHITLQIKTLNSRYFEAKMKLPHALSPIETTVFNRCKKALLRGYVVCSGYLDNPALFKGNVAAAPSTAQGYYNALETIKTQCNLSDQITLSLLSQLPNVFSIEEQELDAQMMEKVLTAIDEVVTTVKEERKKEGAELQKDLASRISEMKTIMQSIATRSQAHIAEQKEKVQTLLAELDGNKDERADARTSALYSMLDKIDIHEEIVRFQSHLTNATSLIKSDAEEIGKRLDFTLQELAREINTITAKCSDSTISMHAIDIKVEIEKAREQAQNIV